jgi:hypothetical protein
MPRVPITEDTIANEGDDLFPKLELDDAGEVARLLVPEDAGYREYVHTIRGPVFDNGVPVIKPADRQGGRDRYETYFVGQRICLGRPEVLAENKVDPERCPACEAAGRGIAQGMQPELRYAMPVIRYACRNKNSSEVRTGDAAGGEVLVWALTWRMMRDLGKQFTSIRDLYEIPEGQDVHLRLADIIIEREPGGPMRVKFLPPARTAMRDEGVKRFILALWGDQANRPTDAQLRARCGREPDRGYMTQDVQSAEREWRKVKRYEDTGSTVAVPATAQVTGQQDLSADLDSLLTTDGGGQAAPAAATAAPASDLSGLDVFAPQAAAATPANGAAVAADPLADTTAPAAAPAAPAAVAPAAAPAADDLAGLGTAAPAAAKPAGDTKSFDDVLGMLG